MQKDLLNDSRDCSVLILFGREFHNLAPRHDSIDSCSGKRLMIGCHVQVYRGTIPSVLFIVQTFSLRWKIFKTHTNSYIIKRRYYLQILCLGCLWWKAPKTNLDKYQNKNKTFSGSARNLVAQTQNNIFN